MRNSFAPVSPAPADMFGALFMGAAVVFIFLLIFLVCREIVTWYWKINKIVDLLEDIKENTSKHVIEKETHTAPKPARKSVSDLLKTEIKL